MSLLEERHERNLLQGIRFEFNGVTGFENGHLVQDVSPATWKLQLTQQSNVKGFFEAFATEDPAVWKVNVATSVITHGMYGGPCWWSMSPLYVSVSRFLNGFFLMQSSQIVNVAVSKRMLAFTPCQSDWVSFSLSLASLHGKRVVLGMRQLFENMAPSLEPTQHFSWNGLNAEQPMCLWLCSGLSAQCVTRPYRTQEGKTVPTVLYLTFSVEMAPGQVSNINMQYYRAHSVRPDCY